MAEELTAAPPRADPEILPADPCGSDAHDPMIRFEGVSVHFDSVTALREVSGSVAPGEWVGIIGPNGAGKTTLLRVIAQLQHHDGLVQVGGLALRDLPRRRRARLVAYVPQKPELPPGMTAIDYTLLGRTPHHGYFGDETDADRERCAGTLEQLGASALAGRQLSSLSGGELQKIVLARALAQDTPVLLMDEPTSALDLGRRVEALELVDQLRLEKGLTVVTAIHDLTLAGQFVDQLMLISDGRIVARGSPRAVLDKETLSLHYGTSVRVIATPEGDRVVVPRRNGLGRQAFAGASDGVPEPWDHPQAGGSRP